MNATLSNFQDSFARALFALDPGVTGAPADFDTHPDMAALVSQAGFAIYRNTALKACVDALQANYPSVLRLVGEPWFRAAAALYARAHAPNDSRMLMFGERFPEFLADFPQAEELTYLPGVARIDRFWTESHGAADAAVLDPAWLSSRPPERLGALLLQPHPAARWCWFADQPIYTLWRNNRESATEQQGELDWKGEGVLITRPQGTVIWRALGAGGCALMEACAAGQSLAQASAAALEAQQDIDFAPVIAALLQAGALRSAVCTDEPTDEPT